LKENSRAFADVMALAKDKLGKIYGIELVEVEGKKGQYIMIYEFTMVTNENHVKLPDEVVAKNGLLAVILSLIFMNGNVLAEEDLWNTLKKIKIIKDGNHDRFGDVKKLVTQEFKQRLYLDIAKVQGSDPPTYEYKWGERAKKEISRKDILQFVCAIYGDKHPEDWLQQYKEAENNARF